MTGALSWLNDLVRWFGKPRVVDECRCECPGGPCDHVFDGPPIATGSFAGSFACSRCGVAMDHHDLWTPS